MNISGGSESQGHARGETDVRLVVELYGHLTSQTGRRQMQNAKICLAQNFGGRVIWSETAPAVTI